MRSVFIALSLLATLTSDLAAGAEARIVVSSAKRRNNLVADLLEVHSIPKPGGTFSFARPSAGWIFIAVDWTGQGTVRVSLDGPPKRGTVIVSGGSSGNSAEGMRHVAKGDHKILVDCDGGIEVTRLVVRAIPELMHCGLGFDPAIKSYGHYDMAFLKKDILPNATTLIVPSNIRLAQTVIDDWHDQGKRFIAEAGVNAQGKKATDHFKYWTGVLDSAPFLDGIIINEFGMNRPEEPPNPVIERREQERHRLYEDAFRAMRADTRYKEKAVYAYFGGSGNKVNYEDTGRTFVRTLIDLKYPIALERYIFERSTEKRSADALQLFVDGIADWDAKEPGVKPQMVIAFGLFSMPPGGLNKLPKVDYHVWMDQQMNVLANHPVMSGMGGIEWWTSILTDEETVRFVGKLYRHYGIEGKTDMLTHDPLFLPHLANADFENGTEGWTLRPAEEGSIQQKSFRRYGRIEGRFMGLGRPADPEHIGDTFLWMKRSAKGPNRFSQSIKKLEPGRLYSLKMFSCDYLDLVNPKVKKQEEANPFIGQVALDGVELDTNRSFTEMYASTPEPRISVWITYHWKVFRAKGTTAELTVSDWPANQDANSAFGQEQTFNFLELQPYHE